MSVYRRLCARPEGEIFENATFLSCDFAEADLSGLRFENCSFEDCRFSAAVLKNAALNGAKFTRCQMAGLNFHDCYKLVFSVSFEDCALDFCSFYGFSLKKTLFKICSLRSAVFTQCDLSGALFERCDLSRAVFHHTKLDKADLSSSFGFVIDPEANSLKKARFSAWNLAGLLEKYDLDVV